ncbi:hypothetical protein GCM10027168_04980 [Streptomyces capparidis]
MRLKNRVKAAGVAAAAVCVSLVPLSGTSYAASCYGTSCDNKGPQATSCADDARTVKTVNNGDHKVELRWSNTCMAGWARGTDIATGSEWYERFAHIEQRASPSTSSPVRKSLSVVIPKDGSDWTNMLGGGSYYYRVCLSDVNDVECSGFF